MAVKEIEYNGNKFTISYNLIGKEDKAILFLHGWGSNKEIMQGAFGKLNGFKQIYIDMPGFGKSPNDKVALTTQDYANIIELFLEKIAIKPATIAGHSFGGKVATLMKPQNLILLSSAGVLVPKSFKTKAIIAIFKMLKPLGIKKFRKFFVANDAKEMNQAMYETFKNVVDEEFEHNFKNFSGKALLFWGKKDTATPLWTAEKISNLIQNSKLYPLDGDHFFFVNNSDFIINTIQKEI